jgi:hypothetical protein
MTLPISISQVSGLHGWTTGARQWYLWYQDLISFPFVGDIGGFELGASCILCRCSTPWAMPPVLFAVVILEVGSLCLDHILLFEISVPKAHATTPSCWQTFCLLWPWTKILWFSASQVARITGVNHWHLMVFDILTKVFHWFYCRNKINA